MQIEIAEKFAYNQYEYPTFGCAYFFFFGESRCGCGFGSQNINVDPHPDAPIFKSSRFCHL